MRALVTGGAGFIGSHLCDALIARGDSVWCVDNLYLGREENIAHLRGNLLFTFCKLDVLDKEGLARLFKDASFDIVYHLAANSDIERGSRDHDIDLKLNFLTTVSVLEAMRANSVKRMFFSSTSAVFGETRERVHEEFGPLRPISFYGASKLAAESYISVFVNNYGLKAAILRFPNVVGERATHGAVYDFMARLRKEPSRLKVLGNGAQTKPYVYVKDLVEAILCVVDKAAEPLAVYHAGNYSLTSVREMAAIVVEEMGLAGIPIEFTDSDRGWVGDVPYFNYDMSKIELLGWRPNCDSTQSVRRAVRRILGKE
jgi:UDP-glucose 4-epimerase